MGGGQRVDALSKVHHRHCSTQGQGREGEGPPCCRANVTRGGGPVLPRHATASQDRSQTEPCRRRRARLCGAACLWEKCKTRRGGGRGGAGDLLMPKKTAACTPGRRRKATTKMSSRQWKASSPWIQRSCGMAGAAGQAGRASATAAPQHAQQQATAAQPQQQPQHQQQQPQHQQQQPQQQPQQHISNRSSTSPTAASTSATAEPPAGHVQLSLSSSFAPRTDQSTAATKRFKPSVTDGPPLSSRHF